MRVERHRVVAPGVVEIRFYDGPRLVEVRRIHIVPTPGVEYRRPSYRRTVAVA